MRTKRVTLDTLESSRRIRYAETRTRRVAPPPPAPLQIQPQPVVPTVPLVRLDSYTPSIQQTIPPVETPKQTPVIPPKPKAARRLSKQKVEPLPRVPHQAKQAKSRLGLIAGYVADTPFRLKGHSKLKLAGALVLVILGTAPFVSSRFHHAYNQAVAATTETVVQAATANESETQGSSDVKEGTKPKPIVYAPNQPKSIRIGSIGVSAPILSVGTTKDGAMDTPYDIGHAGWYNKSAHPGEPGVVLIDGHVGEPNDKAVFKKLQDLAPGEVIELEQGDGKTFKYVVIRKMVYEKDAMNAPEIYNPIGDTPGLNLITCTGNFDKKSENYDRRLVVFTQLQ